jgi:hypothetical protein
VKLDAPRAHHGRKSRKAYRAQRHHYCTGVRLAFPILESYTLTQSWSREMKRTGRATLSAISFRVPDNEIVFAWHYREQSQAMTAAEAVGYIRGRSDPRGYEIMLPRRVNPNDIVRVRVLPKAIGWRYYPETKGKAPWLCDCEVCVPRGFPRPGETSPLRRRVSSRRSAIWVVAWATSSRRMREHSSSGTPVLALAAGSGSVAA